MSASFLTGCQTVINEHNIYEYSAAIRMGSDLRLAKSGHCPCPSITVVSGNESDPGIKDTACFELFWSAMSEICNHFGYLTYQVTYCANFY